MKGNKALTMEPLEKSLPEQPIFAYGQSLPIKEEVLAKFKETTVKGCLLYTSNGRGGGSSQMAQGTFFAAREEIEQVILEEMNGLK